MSENLNKSPELLESLDLDKETIELEIELTKGEIDEIKSQFFNNGVEVFELKEELAAYNKAKRADIKALVDAQLVGHRTMKTGFEKRNVECWLEDDQEKGVMNYYRVDTGEYIKNRRLKPDERQTKIHRMVATGTDGSTGVTDKELEKYTKDRK